LNLTHLVLWRIFRPGERSSRAIALGPYTRCSFRHLPSLQLALPCGIGVLKFCQS
jgi:hypothetical protein